AAARNERPEGEGTHGDLPPRRRRLADIRRRRMARTQHGMSATPMNASRTVLPPDAASQTADSASHFRFVKAWRPSERRTSATPAQGGSGGIRRQAYGN